MRLWSGRLYVFTPAELEQLPDGTGLTCIDGTKVIKGRDAIDTDTRAGHIAYGVVDPWVHPLKDLFLIFKLKQL